MSWKTFALCLTVIGILWCAALWYVTAGRPLSHPRLYTYVAYMNNEGYKVQAEAFETDGFCTVFLKDGRRFAAVCGQHTVSEAEE